MDPRVALKMSLCIKHLFKSTARVHRHYVSFHVDFMRKSLWKSIFKLNINADRIKYNVSIQHLSTIAALKWLLSSVSSQMFGQNTLGSDYLLK